MKWKKRREGLRCDMIAAMTMGDGGDHDGGFWY